MQIATVMEQFTPKYNPIKSDASFASKMSEKVKGNKRRVKSKKNFISPGGLEINSNTSD